MICMGGVHQLFVWEGPRLRFVWEAGSDLYGRLAVIYVWEAGSDLYGRLAAICMGGWQRFVWRLAVMLYGRLAVI